MEDKLKILLELTRKMRAAQKSYFATRNQSQLEESKRLERLVDLCVVDIDRGQEELFGD